jgi:ABC-type siderophore export system fused ATPase/permease subunit
MVLKAYVSMQRIEEFLSESEVPKWASTLAGSNPVNSNGDIRFSSATFEWPSLPKSVVSPSRFELGPIDLTFPKSKLTLVSGATGSGKSALLSALLGGKFESNTSNCLLMMSRDALHCRKCFH